MENMDKRVQEEMKNVDKEKKAEILENFENFKQYLGGKVELGEKMGMSDERIAHLATKVGDYLSKKEEPRNREEHLLQELWKVGKKDEQHMLAHMLVRMVKQDSK